MYVSMPTCTQCMLKVMNDEHRICLNTIRSYYLFQPSLSAATNRGAASIRINTVIVQSCMYPGM